MDLSHKYVDENERCVYDLSYIFKFPSEIETEQTESA